MMNKKLILWIFVSLFLISSFASAYDYDISELNYLQNISMDTTNIKRGISISEDGEKYIIVDTTLKQFLEYDLSIPYDITTSSYNDTTSLSQTTLGLGAITNNGTYLFADKSTTTQLYWYNLSTPYDVSSLSYVNNWNYGTHACSLMRGLDFSENGNHMYIMCVSPIIGIYKSNLSTPYNPSTIVVGSETSHTLSGALQSIEIIDDGNKILISNGSDATYYLYNVTDIDDIDTMVLDSTYDFSIEDASYTSTYYSTQNGNLYSIGVGTDTIIQYEWFLPSNNFTITAINNITSTALTDFNITLDGVSYDDNSTGSVITELLPNSTELHNITINKYGFESQTFINYNVSENLEVSLYPDHTELTVTATDYLSAAILNFTAYGESLNSSNSSFKLTTTGSAVMWLKWNETYNVSVVSEDHAEYLNFETIVMDNYTKAISIDGLYITNTINFTFKDEVSNDLVTDITVFLISDIYSENYSTGGDSNLTVDMIEPADYEIQYTATGYAPRSFSFVLSDKSYNNFTLYMANYSNTHNITANVFDETGSKLPDALIEVLKYDYTTNSYKLVEQKTTNFNGITVLNLQKNTVYYKFRIKYKGVVRLTTNPTFIYQDSISFNVNTEDDATEDFFNKEKVDYSLIFNSQTNNFRFEFSDTTNSFVTMACVYVSRDFNGIITDNYNSSCVSSGSGTILVGIEEINNTGYIAKAYVTIDGESIFMASDSVYFGIEGNTGLLGLFLVVLLMITFALLFSWNLVAAVVMFPVPLWLGSLIGLITLDLSVGLFMQVFAIIIAIVISNKS